MVKKELSSNPEVIGLQARMQGAESLVNQKRSISGKEMAGTVASNDIGASVIPERVNSAALAMGVDPTNARAAAEIRAQLATGNGPAVKAEQLASMSAIQLVGISASDTPEAKQADNVLNSKFANPGDVEYIKTQVKNFDTLYLPGLSKEQQAEFAPSAMSMATSAEAKKMEASVIQAKKTQFVLERFQAMRTDSFATGIANVGAGGWDNPTDPILQELPTVVNDIKTANPDAKIDVAVIASRMDWSQNAAAKQKALSNYVYSQALKEPNNKALGLPTGYHSPEAIEKMVQAQVVLANTRSRNEIMLTSRFGITLPAKGN